MTYDAETLKVVWERLAEDAGVELLLHTWATGVRLDDDRRSGRSGCGTRAASAGSRRRRSSTRPATPTSRAMAGAGYDDASTTPEGVQSLSTLFKLANVDVERATAVPKAELWGLMREAVEHAGYRLPRRRGLVAPHAVPGRRR